MPTIELSAAAVQAIRATPRAKKETFFDEIVTGFVLEARPGGGATYAYRYKDEYGRQRQYKIANAADVTFAEAKKKVIRIKSQTVIGENPAEQRKANRAIPTLNELAERYLEYVRTYKRSPEIDERYLRLHLLPRFGRLHLDQLKQIEIMDWLNSKVAAGYAQATVNRWQVILGHMIRMAKKWGLPGADRNPLEGVKQKDPNNRVERFLTADETRRLKEAVDASTNPMLKYIVALLLLTGCRKRELMDATWDQFDMGRKSWRIPMSKTGKARHVPLSEDALNVLAAVPRFRNCDYVVPNPDTLKPFSSVFHAWDTARHRAGIPDARMHDLRHSCASNLVNAGQSLYVVAKVLGHAQVRTSERYAHLAPETLLTAVNAASAATGTTWAAEKSA